MFGGVKRILLLAALLVATVSGMVYVYAQSNASGSGGGGALTPGTSTTPGIYSISIPGVFTSAQYNNTFITSLTGGGSCTNNASFKNTEVIQACASTPASGATNAQTVGFASWIYANDPTQDGTNPVSTDVTVAGAKFVANCQVSHTYCYGGNPQANDVASMTDTHVIGEEVDADSFNTTTVGFGLVIENFGTGQPTADNFPAVQAGLITSAWTSGFKCQQGAVTNNAGIGRCVNMQPLGAASPTNSQSIEFNARNSGGTVFPLDLLMTINATNGLPLLTSGQSYSLVTSNVFSRQTAQVAGNIALGAGWGTTATVSAVNANSYSQRMRFTITSNGTGQAANPTVTITYSDPMPFTPLCYGIQGGGTGTQAMLFPGTESATSSGAMVWQGGTPAAASTYIFTVDCRL